MFDVRIGTRVVRDDWMHLVRAYAPLRIRHNGPLINLAGCGSFMANRSDLSHAMPRLRAGTSGCIIHLRSRCPCGKTFYAKFSTLDVELIFRAYSICTVCIMPHSCGLRCLRTIEREREKLLDYYNVKRSNNSKR